MKILSIEEQTHSSAESIIQRFLQFPLNVLHHPDVRFTDEALRVSSEQYSEAEGNLAILGLLGRGIGGEDAIDEARALMKRLKQAREEREADERRAKLEYRGLRIQDWLAMPQPEPVEAPEEPEVLGGWATEARGGNVAKIPDIEVEGDYKPMKVVENKVDPQFEETDNKTDPEQEYKPDVKIDIKLEDQLEDQQLKDQQPKDQIMEDVRINVQEFDDIKLEDQQLNDQVIEDVENKEFDDIKHEDQKFEIHGGESYDQKFEVKYEDNVDA
jgi:hypothetical protein